MLNIIHIVMETPMYIILNYVMQVIKLCMSYLGSLDILPRLSEHKTYSPWAHIGPHAPPPPPWSTMSGITLFSGPLGMI